MARNCCICGKKIGMLSSANKFFDDTDELVICDACLYKWNQLQDIMKVRYDKRSVMDYFRSCLNGTSVNPRVQNKILSELSNAQQKIKSETVKAKVYDERRSESIAVFANEKLITTGFHFQGYEIIKYCGLVSGEVVLGTGFLSEFSAGFSDFFGSASNQFAEKMVRAKGAAKKKLIDNVIDAGGNAVIGVDFDYITFGNNMIGVSANGTAVVVKKVGV